MAVELEPEDKDGTTDNPDIHGYLEEKRVQLEAEVGLERLLKVYKLIALMEEEESEQVDYSDLRDVLGVGNEHFIDDIIQLVVADNFY